MRLTRLLLILAISLTTLGSYAADPLSLEKVKMGILPAGGLYEVFDVTCHDQATVSLVSTERRRRWCTQFDGQVNCFKRAQEASHAACATQILASSEQGLESFDQELATRDSGASGS